MRNLPEVTVEVGGGLAEAQLLVLLQRVLHVGGELLEVDGVDVGLVVDQPRLALGQNLRDLRLHSISALLTFLEYSVNKIIYLGLK